MRSARRSRTCGLGTSCARDAWLAETEPGWRPEQSIRDASAVLTFIVVWRYEVQRTPGLSLGTDCMTRETLTDTVTSTFTCILRFPQFRGNTHRPRARFIRPRGLGSRARREDGLTSSGRPLAPTPF